MINGIPGGMGRLQRACRLLLRQAGVIHMIGVPSFERAQHKINLDAIAPTFVNTSFVAALLQDDKCHKEVLSRIPQGRLAEVIDVVGAAVFLSSPASDMVTGHTQAIDGGWTAV
jgi:NAD(P)-dependent dehydrogenase (short-subunit alcohol dehydrogenase family)